MDSEIIIRQEFACTYVCCIVCADVRMMKYVSTYEHGHIVRTYICHNNNNNDNKIIPGEHICIQCHIRTSVAILAQA